MNKTILTLPPAAPQSDATVTGLGPSPVPAGIEPSLAQLGQTDVPILQAINRFGYLTASQTSRLFYPNCHDDNRYARRRLAHLSSAGYLLRLRSLPPRLGSTPVVYTLGRLGRDTLALRGEEVSEAYFRPSEERHKAGNPSFLTHTLAVIDVLVAAACLCRDSQLGMPRLLTERQLRRQAIQVTPPGHSRPVAVIPDAWFQLGEEGQEPAAIALELDRSSEHVARWRRKIAALTSWLHRPYQQAFRSDYLQIAVVTPDPVRRDRLRDWTARELSARGHPEAHEFFLFTSADPATTPPEQFFYGPLWYQAGEGPAGSLLEPPKPPASLGREASGEP